MALPKNPTFTTAAGIVFNLKPIPPFVLNRFQIEFIKNNPPPKPPMREAEIAGVRGLVTDDKNAYYLEEKDRWDAIQQSALMSFVLANGVKESPNGKWKVDEEQFGDHLKEYEKKALWIQEQLLTESDMALTEKIISMLNVTPDALDSAEKK